MQKGKDTKVEIVIPAYNEEQILEKNIDKLMAFLKDKFAYKNYKVIIVDNGSSDNTLHISQKLEKRYKKIGCIHLSRKGRGRSLKKVWLESEADVLCYMDADLSTDLKTFPELVNSIIIDGYDIAVGSRLLPTSKVDRSLLRRYLSYTYNILLKTIFRFKELPDAQCGFKALNRKVIKTILPKVKNQNWFFDTELLILAQKSGLKIKYIPVNWKDRPKSRVKIVDTIFEDIAGILRLMIRPN
ncbi:MAG: glycosyltransferase family 2 protein [Candidatus Omnitrophota bacterium]|nr:MAG: glycosyltransferase family 2 protein [Candidatus Omnitrophota bacterium]